MFNQADTCFVKNLNIFTLKQALKEKKSKTSRNVMAMTNNYLEDPPAPLNIELFGHIFILPPLSRHCADQYWQCSVGTTCDTGAMCAGVRLSHDWQSVRHGEAWHRWALCTPCTAVHTLYSGHWSPSRTSWDRQSFTRVQSSLTQCPLRRRTPCHLHPAAALLDKVPLYITVHSAPDSSRHGPHNIMGWSMETPSPGPTTNNPPSQPSNQTPAPLNKEIQRDHLGLDRRSANIEN